MEGNKGKFYLLSNLALFLLLAYLSYNLIFRKIPYIPILDDGNLLIHEAGHIVFGPFANLIGLMGGSILQLTVPTLFLVYFLFKSSFTSFTKFFTAKGFDMYLSAPNCNPNSISDALFFAERNMTLILFNVSLLFK